MNSPKVEDEYIKGCVVNEAQEQAVVVCLARIPPQRDYCIAHWAWMVAANYGKICGMVSLSREQRHLEVSSENCKVAKASSHKGSYAGLIHWTTAVPVRSDSLAYAYNIPARATKCFTTKLQRENLTKRSSSERCPTE